MKNLICFLMLLQALCLQAHGAKSKLYDTVGCQVLDETGVTLRHFGGLRCLFFDDGRVLVGSWKHLQFYDKDMNLLWQRKIHTHHQLNLNLKKDKILVMTSTFKDFNGQKVRYDRLSIYSFEGKEVAFFDFADRIETIKKIALDYDKIRPKKMHREFFGTDLEMSHANSFYEIGPNKSAGFHKAFQPGNYIVNSVRPSVMFILDSKLEKVLWHKNMNTPAHRKNKTWRTVHDAKVLPSGKILFFDNSPDPVKQDHSAISEYDPVADTVRTIFRANPPQAFASVTGQGGVQILPDGGMISVSNSNGGELIEIDRHKKIIRRLGNITGMDKKTGKTFPILEAKRLPLGQFLKNNKPL